MGGSLIGALVGALIPAAFLLALRLVAARGLARDE